MAAALVQAQTFPMHSMGMDVRGGLFCFPALAIRLVAGCWPLSMLLSGCFSQPTTWCLSCFSMSSLTHAMSAFSGPITSWAHSLSHPFLVLPAPTSHQYAFPPNILCFLIYFPSDTEGTSLNPYQMTSLSAVKCCLEALLCHTALEKAIRPIAYSGHPCSPISIYPSDVSCLLRERKVYLFTVCTAPSTLGLTLLL